MKIKGQIGNLLGGKLIEEDVRWLVVYDQYDQPLAALEQLTDNHVLITRCSDPKFRSVIRRYGIEKLPRTEVVDDSA